MSVLEQLRRLAELKAGWDSYGGLPLDGRVPRVLYRVLVRFAEDDAQITVVPCSDGGVQAEWATVDTTIELRVHPDGEWEYTETFDSRTRTSP